MRALPRLLLPGPSLALVALALACASAPPADHDATYEVVHEGFGFRADLDGWQVYRDAESAPPLLRAAFGTKHGPDDPPLFLALRGDLILSAIVRPETAVDSRQLFDRLAAGIAKKGEVTGAIRLPDSGDILFSYRVGSGSFAAYSRALVHVAEGRSVNLTLTGVGEPPSEQTFVDAIAGVELYGEAGWQAPWRLPVPIEGEALAGFEGEGGRHVEDPFQAVECAPGQHPLLWTGPAADGGRLYLFGSIHVGHPSFYPFAPAIEEAFASADRLVVEVDARSVDTTDLTQLTLETGSLPAGQKLSDVVSPELYARVGEAAEELGLAPEIFDGMSPGAASLVISVMPLLQRGFDPSAGVDQYFLDRATGKEIVELETWQQQSDLMGALDERSLRAALDGMKTFDQDLDALYRAWRCGDEKALTRAVFGDRERAATPEARASADDLSETFLFGRNREMARAIGELLAKGGNTFVVVGAAHLVGAQGIPALLRAAGHPVEVVGP
jgi:uncharacterized protein YbaP (TraB family)